MPVIAVTGATGFIGRRFVQLMVERGAAGLRVLVRESNRPAVFAPSVTTVRGDLARPSSFSDLLTEGCTVVNLVHLEGISPSAHVHSFQALLDACVAAGVKRLVHCSTATVAGRAAADVITESTECLPGNDYEAAKLATERALLERGAGRIEVTILRPTAVFGPGGRNLVKLADDLIGRSAALNYLVSCLQSRRRMNLVHVDNVAAALSLLAGSDAGVAGNTFIVSDDDSPANNYRDVERQLRDCLGLSRYPVAPAGLPPAALSLALRLTGRTNTNPGRVYDCSRILAIGLARPMPFARGIVEFGGWACSATVQSAGLKVLNVNFAIDTAVGGGTGERTFQLSRFLAASGVSCAVLALDLGVTPERVAALAGVPVTALRCVLPRYLAFPLPEPRIAELVEWADIVHLMGHWTLLNAAVYREARRARKPYVVCPAGALPISGRSTILKAIYNKAIGTRIVREANACIAITDKERPDFHAYGVADDRIFRIPNGIDPDEFSAADPVAFRRRFGLPRGRLILYVGRLHELKGPDLLLNAFAGLAGAFAEFHLVFAGPDGGQLARLQAMAAEAGIAGRTHFLGHLGGKDRADAYAAASLVAIPSRREAMSIVVLEAGACATPVLITDQCGFDEVETIGGGKVVPATVEGLKGGLRTMITGLQDLPGMGARMSAYTRENFSWPSMVSLHRKLFERVLAGGGNSRR